MDGTLRRGNAELRVTALAVIATGLLVGGCDSSDDESSAGGRDGGEDAGSERADAQVAGGGGRSGAAGRGARDAGGAGAAGRAGSGGASGRSGSGGAGAGAGGAGGAGGALEPNPMLADLGDDTARDLGRFECETVDGEEDGLCRRATDYSGMVYDPGNHQILSFGGGHSTTMTDAIHALDLGGSLTWNDLYPPTPCAEMTAENLDEDNGAWQTGPQGPFPRPVSTHTYDMLAVDPERDEFIVVSRVGSGGYCNPVGNDIGGKIAHFDLEAGSWSFSPSAEGSTYELAVDFPGGERDPMSGLIVLLSRQGLSVYDPETREYTHVDGALADSTGGVTDISQIGYANHLVYFPPDDTFYLFARGTPVEVYALHFDRDQIEMSTVDHVPSTGPTSSHGEPGYDYDSQNQIIGGAVQDSTFYAFDPGTATWEAHPMHGGTPGNQAFHALAYDPVDNVFIFVTDYDSGQKTWAYRLGG